MVTEITDKHGDKKNPCTFWACSERESAEMVTEITDKHGDRKIRVHSGPVLSARAQNAVIQLFLQLLLIAAQAIF
jgi:hypothetical protein